MSVVEHRRPFDPVSAVWRRRWLIVIVTILCIGVGIAITLRTPKSYRSTATLFVPRDSSNANLLAGLAASGALQQLQRVAIPTLNPNRDLILGVLRSRTLTENVAARFNLQQRYGARYREDATRMLQGLTTVVLSREGLIVLTVEDREPTTAVRIVEAYVAELQQLVSNIGLGEANRQRVFVGQQLARARGDLGRAEQALRAFQERNRAIVLQEQTKGAIEAAAKLKGEIMAAEVQMNVLRSFATDVNPDVVTLRRRIEEMQRHLGEMQYGNGAPAGGRDFAVPFARVPEVGLELARLTRELKIQETLVSVLAQNLEQAKIAEARDLPVVQIIDNPVTAERPARPRPFFNVTVAGAVGVVGGILVALGLERRRTYRESRQHPTDEGVRT